jgi:UDP-3-O-acyl-N-acetylglucosamine deacetylase
MHQAGFTIEKVLPTKLISRHMIQEEMKWNDKARLETIRHLISSLYALDLSD